MIQKLQQVLCKTHYVAQVLIIINKIIKIINLLDKAISNQANNR